MTLPSLGPAPPLLLLLVGATPFVSASWTLFIRQTGGNVQPADDWRRFNTDANDGGGADAENYSILDELERCRSGGVFTFKMLWPQGSIEQPGIPLYNIWSQTSNPLEVGPTVLNFKPIDLQCPQYTFAGLTYGASRDNDQALLCNDCVGGNWWHSLGSVNGPCADMNNFPGCNCVQVAELWVECTTAWGLIFILTVALVSAIYVGSGMYLGMRGGRMRRESIIALSKHSNMPQAMRAHPHWVYWAEGGSLVSDGLLFTFGPGGNCWGRIRQHLNPEAEEPLLVVSRGGGHHDKRQKSGSGGKKERKDSGGKESTGKKSHNKQSKSKSKASSSSLALADERQLVEVADHSVHSSMARIKVASKEKKQRGSRKHRSKH